MLLRYETTIRHSIFQVVLLLCVDIQLSFVLRTDFKVWYMVLVQLLNIYAQSMFIL
jgi:hypothetical protein